ncbi:MAG: hypothetical protein ABIS17_11845 [Casimicrobiaceae bacterium]
MRAPRKIVILGASYGSLLGMKLLLAGHTVKLICLPAEAELINAEGFRVRTPVRGQKDLVEVDSRKLSGKLSAGGPESVDPADNDLVVLAMQEPQYRADAIRAVLQKVAKARVPCMSIMNMPPLPYLARIPGFDSKAARHCYADATVWDVFDPDTMTLCSPDPQAFRPPDEKVNVLQVSLPTNFKAARFVSDEHTALLRDLAEDVEAARFSTPDGPVALPVKLKVHDSVFVPLAKWSMLLTGNYRCIQEDGMRAIRDAVHTDGAASRAVYEWVGRVCKAHGATDADLVPFEKYAAAAEGLAKPSSAARALAAGAPFIERVDRLVQAAAAQKDMRSDAVDAIVRVVDSWVERNRRKAAA